MSSSLTTAPARGACAGIRAEKLKSHLRRGPCSDDLVALAQLRRIRIAQRAEDAGCRGGGGEAVAAEHIEILVLERGQAGDVLVADLVALVAQLVDGGVDVPGGPQHDGAEDQAERAEPILHPVPRPRPVP